MSALRIAAREMALLATISLSGCNDSSPPTVGDPSTCVMHAGDPPIAGPMAAQTCGDQMFRSLTVDPTNPDVVYAGSEGNGMFRSRDGGKTWTWLRTGLRNLGDSLYAETWDMAVAPSRPLRLYAATSDSPGPASGTSPSARAGVYRSEDGGDTWTQLDCDLPNSKASSVVVSPTDPDSAWITIYAGRPSFMGAAADYYIGGVFGTSDGGAHWNALPLPPDYQYQAYFRSLLRGDTLFTFAVASDVPGHTSSLGFLRSDDRGKSWRATMDPLAGDFVVEFDASSDGKLLYAQPRNGRPLLRSTNAGDHFDPVFNESSGPVAISPANPDLVLAADRGVLRRTESAFADYIQVLRIPEIIEEIVFAPSNPDVIYVSTYGLKIYRSADSAMTFTQVADLRAFIESHR